MMEMLTNLVTQSGVSATQLSAILLGVLFLIMIIGLATGQELAFVLGGAGVIIGYLAWGGPGITIAIRCTTRCRAIPWSPSRCSY